MGGGKNITYIHNEMFEAFFRCRLFRRRRRHQRFINELNNEENNEKNKNPKKKKTQKEQWEMRCIDMQLYIPYIA